MDMSHADLVAYIQEQTQQGVSAQALREALMEAGWHERDIENALHDVAAGLHPTTPGASIHEDLAQVRGMVAHLASRVQGIEAALSSVAALPMRRELPEQMLLPGTFVRRWPGRVFAALVGVGGAVGMTIFGVGLQRQESLAALDAMILGGAIAVLGVVASVVAMRHRAAKTASFLVAGSLALGAIVIFTAWRMQGYLEWTVAFALGLLLLVLAIVLGAWIDRLSR